MTVRSGGGGRKGANGIVLESTNWIMLDFTTNTVPVRYSGVHPESSSLHGMNWKLTAWTDISSIRWAIVTYQLLE